MRILANKDIRRLYIRILFSVALLHVLSMLYMFITYKAFSFVLLFLGILIIVIITLSLHLYFYKQDKILDDAVNKVDELLKGNIDARIHCDEEGEIFKLFSMINNLSAVLNSKISKENDEKLFLKNTISDISHQLKTPLAALNIYNGILDDAEDLEQVKEFVNLSENELDRIETLVQNLLKITRLDAGTLVLNKTNENVSEIIKDIELHFAYRTKLEGKKLQIKGEENVFFYCDREWFTEAIENLVKNALDHTASGNYVLIEWKQFNTLLQIIVKDNGSGIHPEDIHHIFKRFYRSRFSKDSQGLGLGLALTKAIIEAHGGSIEVSSELNKGTSFTMNFLIPTK